MPDAAFWRGVFLANIGKINEARTSLARSFELHSDFKELLERLPEVGALDEALLAALSE